MALNKRSRHFVAGILLRRLSKLVYCYSRITELVDLARVVAVIRLVNVHRTCSKPWSSARAPSIRGYPTIAQRLAHFGRCRDGSRAAPRLRLGRRHDPALLARARRA